MSRILHHLQRDMLRELVEAGHGTLDTHSRVCVGPIKRPIAGDAIAWLVLVSHGYVAGERGLVIPTEDGRAYVNGLLKGREREREGA